MAPRVRKSSPMPSGTSDTFLRIGGGSPRFRHYPTEAEVHWLYPPQEVLRASSLRGADRLYGVPTESFSTSMFVGNRKRQRFRYLRDRRCPNCRRQESAGW